MGKKQSNPKPPKGVKKPPPPPAPPRKRMIAEDIHPIRLLMRFICRVFGHIFYFDSDDVAGSSTCRLCGCKKNAIGWPR